MTFISSIKLVKPTSFLNVGEFGEINGNYYRLDGVNELCGVAYFTPIKIHKLKLSNGYVEVDDEIGDIP